VSVRRIHIHREERPDGFLLRWPEILLGRCRSSECFLPISVSLLNHVFQLSHITGQLYSISAVSTSGVISIESTPRCPANRCRKCLARIKHLHPVTREDISHINDTETIVEIQPEMPSSTRRKISLFVAAITRIWTGMAYVRHPDNLLIL